MYQIKQLQYLPCIDETGNNPENKYLIFTDTEDDQKGIDVGWVAYGNHIRNPFDYTRDIQWTAQILNKEVYCSYGSRDKIPDHLKEEIQLLFEKIVNRSIYKNPMDSTQLTPIERWKSLYKAPFRYNPESQMIFDAKGNMIADEIDCVIRIRGWGKISYEENAAEIQDAFGNELAKILNEWYDGGGRK